MTLNARPFVGVFQFFFVPGNLEQSCQMAPITYPYFHKRPLGCPREGPFVATDMYTNTRKRSPKCVPSSDYSEVCAAGRAFELKRGLECVQYTHTLSHTLTNSHELSLSLSLSLPFSLSLSPTLPLSHSPTLPLSHSSTHSLTHLASDRARGRKRCCRARHTLSPSLTLQLSHSPTHSRTHLASDGQKRGCCA